MTPWTSAGLSLLGEADGQEPNDAIEHAWRSSSVEASRGVEGRFRGRDARVDEHSPGPRLHRIAGTPLAPGLYTVLLPLIASRSSAPLAILSHRTHASGDIRRLHVDLA